MHSKFQAGKPELHSDNCLKTENKIQIKIKQKVLNYNKSYC